MVHSSEVLLNLGFIDIARWITRDDGLTFEVDHVDAKALEANLGSPTALYAFVVGNRVQYIGKTTRSVRQRFVGYRRPGLQQTTNIRCHNRIRGVLASGGEVRILLFTPITQLRYADFEINLAAGLEDSLIKAFDPPWNGREHGQPITEEAEREEQDTSAEPLAEGMIPVETSSVGAQVVSQFQIRVGETYYHQGFLNPGVEASKHLGADGELVNVMFNDGTLPVTSSINRTANRNGSVRVVGRNGDIARWLQTICKVGDTIEGQVLNANTVRLLAPREPR